MTIKINTTLSILNDLPQKVETKLLNELFLISDDDYNCGIKLVKTSLTNVSSGGVTDQDFELNCEILSSKVKSIFLFSEKPVFIKILNEIYRDVYHFSIVKDQEFDVWVANFNSDEVKLRYIFSKNSASNSSYVYS